MIKDSLKEPKLTYALDALGKMVCIDSVERGLACHCLCPKCNEPLEAKLGYGGRQPHFAHKKGSDCHGFYMTALHKLAEQIIEEEKAVMAPEYKEIAKQRLSFTQVEVEQRVERKDLQPDLVGVTEDGLRWTIEIRNTHEVDKAKRTKLIESNITCLEIDVREQTLENLKSFILESSENRVWINNPNYDAQIFELKRKSYSNNPKYEVRPSSDCIFECKYKLYEGECIYKKDIVILKGLKHVVCDKEKRLKDENECQTLHRNKEDSITFEESQHDINNIYQDIEKLQMQSYVKSTNENLPFDRFWTLEEFGITISSGFYEDEKGNRAEIIKHEKIASSILILYKDSNEVRTYSPYHIVIISINSGDIIRNEVAVFHNNRAALNCFYERSKNMRLSSYLKSLTEDDNCNLPF